jgi:beta-glucanase (GH16 family)
MKIELSRSVSGPALPLVVLLGFGVATLSVPGRAVMDAPPLPASGAVAVAVAGAGVSAAVPKFPPVGFELKLAEDFSTEQLNTELWNTSLKVFGRWGDRYHNDSYLNYLSDEDVFVEEGRLRLRAERRSVEGDNPPGIYDFSAGMVSSHDKFSFLYGYIEIRAKFPGGPGVWPAFWLMPQSHQWPPEFDIAEYYAGRKMMHLGLCHGDFPQINWDSGGNDDVAFEQGWQTYGLLWMPGRAVWTQNGVVKREISGPHVPNIPMYVILSNGVSSRIGPSGEPDGTTTFPNFFEVDTLRVWQPVSGGQAAAR